MSDTLSWRDTASEVLLTVLPWAGGIGALALNEALQKQGSARAFLACGIVAGGVVSLYGSYRRSRAISSNLG